MSWSGKIPFYEALKAKGKLKAEDVMPETTDGDALLMQIFSEISSTRSVGMGVGPIPANIYWEVQKRYGLTDAAIEVLRHLDMEFVKQNASNT